jgi:hypothetical protein
MAVNIAGMPTCHESKVPLARTHHVNVRIAMRDINQVVNIGDTIR